LFLKEGKTGCCYPLQRGLPMHLRGSTILPLRNIGGNPRTFSQEEIEEGRGGGSGNDI